MRGQISAFPLGLLSMLGLKQQGEYPKELMNSYLPSLEMLDFIACTNGTTVKANVFNLALGATSSAGRYAFGAGLEVPDNEVWLVTDVAVIGYANGFGSILPELQIGYDIVGGGSIIFPGLESIGRQVLGNREFGATGQRGHFFVPGGSSFFVLVGTDAVCAGECVADVVIRYVPMRV